jgi:hypothetical protein
MLSTIALVVALTFGQAPAAPAATDLGGMWVRSVGDPVAGGAGARTEWGERVVITQQGDWLVVSHGEGIASSRYLTDGTPVVAETPLPCERQRLRSQAVWIRDQLEITETATSQAGCRHGEATLSFASVEDGGTSLPQWTRAVDSVTGQPPTWRKITLQRTGDTLFVHITHGRAGGATWETDRAYRRE